MMPRRVLPFSAGRAARQVKFGIQNLLLALQQVVGQQLGFHVLKAQALDGLGEALAGLPLLPEEENGLLNDAERLLLVSEDLAEGPALGHLLAQRPPM